MFMLQQAMLTILIITIKVMCFVKSGSATNIFLL
jgi:hypothetical protein